MQTHNNTIKSFTCKPTIAPSKVVPCKPTIAPSNVVPCKPTKKIIIFSPPAHQQNHLQKQYLHTHKKKLNLHTHKNIIKTCTCTGHPQKKKRKKKPPKVVPVHPHVLCVCTPRRYTHIRQTTTNSAYCRSAARASKPSGVYSSCHTAHKAAGLQLEHQSLLVSTVPAIQPTKQQVCS